MRRAGIILLSAALAACAGYRGGWESVAYLGDAPPAALADAAAQDLPKPAFRLPGMELKVTLDNRVRSYDTQVMMAAVPVSVDPRDTFVDNHVPGRTRVFVTVTPGEPGFVFRPALARLQVGEQQFAATRGHLFGMWNDRGERVAQGGKWEHRPVDGALPLGDTGRAYLLSIDFPTSAPPPTRRDLAVDLSRALTSAHHPPPPLVRFWPARWKQGYT